MLKTPTFIVLDTNIVLDLWLFDDVQCASLRHLFVESKGRNALIWLATPAMRDELRAVLQYTHLRLRMQYYENQGKWQHEPGEVAILRLFDENTQMCSPAERAPCVCKDSDDQKFIDLAVAHQAHLISKDKAVLKMKNRLLKLGATVAKTFELNQKN